MTAPSATPPAAATLAAVHAQAVPLIGTRDELVLGPVLRSNFQRDAATVGDFNPLYFDEALARSAGYPGLIAPPMYLSSVMGWHPGPPADTLREDGLAEGDLLPVALPGLRLMGGGQDLEFLGTVHEHAQVHLCRELTDVQWRAGRSGAIVLFTVRRDYTDERGSLLVRCRETFIAR